MPVEYIASNLHRIIPDPSTGYELAPVTGKGLWSIVSPDGIVTNLNTLGIEVLAYTGAGMPPIENITTPFGILGGSVYQRTVVRSRQIILVCAVQGQALGQIQRIKQGIINQVAPYNSVQAARQLKLRYQLVNYCGDLIGTTLEVPVIYDGDLTGSVTNLYQDRFSLVFTELAPPGVVELATIQPSLAYYTALGTINGVQYRTSAGVWTILTASQSYGPVNAMLYDASGDLWWGGSNTVARVATRSGSVSQVVSFVATPASTVVAALAQAANGDMYVGGNFTSPQNYIMKYSGGVFSAVGATINGIVYALCSDNAGNLYAGGAFTAPVGGFGKWNGTTWATLGAGAAGIGALIYRIIKGLDGNLIISGDFTSFNGVSANNIAKYNVTTGVTTALGSGLNGVVRWTENLPDGRVIAVGDFTLSGPITVNYAAIWNGAGWSPLGGTGLNNTVQSVTVDQSTGDIYLFGQFTALTNTAYPITPTAVKYNGSLFLPIDLYTSNAVFRSAFRASDKELAVGENSSFPVFVGGQTALNYTGTADVIPQIKLTGPGQVYTITNYTTKKAIYFKDLYLQAGETATLTIGGIGGVSFVSSFANPANILGKILPGSDITSFGLRPGTNNITCFMTGTTGASKIELIYQNTHYSFEAGA